MEPTVEKHRGLFFMAISIGMKKTVYPSCVTTPALELERQECRRKNDLLISSVEIPTGCVTINRRNGYRQYQEDARPKTKRSYKQGARLACMHCGITMRPSKLNEHLHRGHVPNQGTLCGYGCGNSATAYSSQGMPCCSSNGNRCPGVKVAKRAALKRTLERLKREKNGYKPLEHDY